MPHIPPALAVHPWAQLSAVLLSRAYRAVLLTLAVIAVLPTALGWEAYVTRSGSMAPSIEVGDVVVARAVDAQDEIEVGRVYVFADPASQHHRLLVHRIVERDNAGNFITAGDANADVDATPLSRDRIADRGILLVPFIGLPVVWLTTHAWTPLLLWLGLTIAAFVLGTRDPEAPPPRGPGRPTQRPARQGGTAGAHRGVGATRKVFLSGSSTVTTAVAAVLLGTSPIANATFTDHSTNGTNSWRAGHWVHRYVEEVLADVPFGFWGLDEQGGTWAADRSGADRTGRYHGIASYGQPGGLPNNPGTSIRPGNGHVVLGPRPVRVPTSHTVELWFRTDSTTGGYLVGFESSTETTSPLADRTLLMDATGRLVYGWWDTNPQNTITTPNPYNDGRWHHVAVSATRHGSQQQATIYVDGSEVASGRTSKVESYDGWWRAGSGTLPRGTTLRAGFDGLIDNIAVYDRALPPERIRAHWAAR